jgi:hypothetical protein
MLLHREGNRIKRKPIEWGKFFASSSSNKRLIYRMYK